MDKGKKGPTHYLSVFIVLYINNKMGKTISQIIKMENDAVMKTLYRLVLGEA